MACGLRALLSQVDRNEYQILKMKITPVVCMLAGLTLAQSSAESTMDFDLQGTGEVPSIQEATIAPLEQRADKKPDPKADTKYGYTICQNADLKAPCTWAETPADGATTCRKLPYVGSWMPSGISFKPDLGVNCQLYQGLNCEDCKSCGRMMINAPTSGNLWDLGKAFIDPNLLHPGFYSVRCRSWRNVEPIAQGKYVLYPDRPW